MLLFSIFFFPLVLSFLSVLNLLLIAHPLLHCLVSICACHILVHTQIPPATQPFCLHCPLFSPDHTAVFIGPYHINFIQVFNVILTAILNNFGYYQNPTHYSNSSIQPQWLSNGLVSQMLVLYYSGTIANCEIRNCILLADKCFLH